VFDIADEVAVMSRGAIVASGPSDVLRHDRDTLNHHLGV
jgi:ABC-type branched-subunit amino acid transport system ATPase component